MDVFKNFIVTQPDQELTRRKNTKTLRFNHLFLLLFSLLLFIIFLPTPGFANLTCTTEVEISDTIGPATLDMIQRSIKKNQEDHCSSILVLINTPGGNLQSTRLIVEEILRSPAPFLCLVYPSGGHAGSAGAIILQACHVNGAMEATNLGAATPVSGEGSQIPEDLRKKLLNDTRSWVEGLAELRKRNIQFSQEIVTEARAVSAAEAKKINAIDFVAVKKQDFLEFAQGRSVQMSESKTLNIQIGELRKLPLDLRYQVVSFFSDPQFSYILFVGSLGLLYFEITHPGMIAPGVVGAVGIILSLISFHKLDVSWGAFLLLILGIGLMIAEAFVPGMGILGVGGTISFLLGSLMLFNPETTGIQLPLSLIIPSSLILGLITLGIAFLAFSSRKNKKQFGTYAELLNLQGEVKEVNAKTNCRGQMEVRGELWNFECPQKVQVGDTLIIKGHKGLTVLTQKVNSSPTLDAQDGEATKNNKKSNNEM